MSQLGQASASINKENEGDHKQHEDVSVAEHPQSTETNAQHSVDDESIRAGWRKSSRCMVFSKSAKQWMPAQVMRVLHDDEGEWVEVKYNGKTIKQLQRHSDDIRPHVESFVSG